MIEALKNQEIIEKAGGRFKLTALVQRRMAELLQGSRPLIADTQGMTLLEIVIQEVLEDKIAIEGSAAEAKAQGEDESAI